MKISIVIPSYNSEKFINDALKSIVHQDYEDYEIIVIDGGSKDNTLSILDHYQWELKNKMRYISEPDKGEPDAINKGMRMATGDIIGYLDSDDIYCKDCFLVVNDYFKKHWVKWAYGKCKIIDEDSQEARSMVTHFKEIFQPYYNYNTLLMFDYIAQPSAFWRREVLDKVGYLDISQKLVFDYDYWLRLGREYKAGFINQYLSCWRSHPKSETAKALAKDMRDGLELAINYSPKSLWLRPSQYGIYWLSLLGYKAMGAL